MSSSQIQPSWIKLVISCDPQIVEEISGEFFANGVEGIEEEQHGLVIYIQAENWTAAKKTWMVNRVQQIDPHFSANQIKTKQVVWEDWTENWKQNFATFRVEPNIIVAPDWEEPQVQPGEQLIKISPKMAFGTGHHETTQLILSLLPANLDRGMQVLDAGTGSGILAILAAKLGAGHVTAFDTDPVAVENARENTELNSIKNKIDIYTGYLSDGLKNKYDLIVANINRNVLLDLCVQWSDYIQPGGKLILSGILETDEEIVRSAYEKKNWRYLNKKQKGEWIALVFSYSASNT